MLKSLSLYLIAVLLFIIVNYDFFEDLQNERIQNDLQKTIYENNKLISKNFELQNISYDSVKGSWKNNSTYFQIMHIDLDKLGKNTTRTIKLESDKEIEKLSDSH